MRDEQRVKASILGGSLAVGSSTAFRLVVNFTIAVLVARLLGAEAKGQLSLMQQVPAIAALVLGLGFDAAHAFHVGRQRKDPSEKISDSLLLTAAVSVIGVPVALLAMRLLVPALAAVPVSTLMLSAAAVPMLLLTAMLGGVLTGLGRIGQLAQAQAAAAGVAVSTAAGFAALGNLTLTAVVAATVAGLAVSAVLSYLAIGIRALPLPSVSRLRAEFGYARRSYVQSVTGYLEMRQDILLLGVLGSAAGVGVYSVGASLAELLIYIPQTFAAALTARSLQEEAVGGAELTARLTRLLTAFVVLAALALATVMRPLVLAVFGPDFAEAATVFVILAPGIVVWGIASQSGAYLATHGRLFPRMSTTTLLINLGLNLALIPVLGARGAALATTVSYSIISGYMLWTFCKATGMRLADIIVIRRSDIAYGWAAIVARCPYRDRDTA